MAAPESFIEPAALGWLAASFSTEAEAPRVWWRHLSQSRVFWHIDGARFQRWLDGWLANDLQQHPSWDILLGGANLGQPVCLVIVCSGDMMELAALKESA
jgi:hypothetical protein